MADYPVVAMPTTLPKDANRIRGASRVYVAPWTAAGANAPAASIVYMGQIADGGVNLTIGREWQELEGEEGYAPDGDVLTKETVMVKATLMEAPIDMISLLMGSPMAFGTPANAMVASDIASEIGVPNKLLLGYGGMQTRASKNPTLYYQIFIETPNEDFTPANPQLWAEPLTRGYWQLFMCRLHLAGDLTFTKKNIVSMPIEISARWDWTVTPVNSTAPGSVDSVGRLFRRVNTYTA